MIAQEIYVNKKTQAQAGNVIRYSIHTEVVPLNGTEGNEQTKGKQKRTKQITNKQTSIERKLELPQWSLSTSPSTFQIFLKNNIYSIIQLAQHFRSTVGLGWPVCSVRCTEQPQNCYPYFETSVKHLSLHYVGLQGSKFYLWAAEQQCLKLSQVMVMLDTYLLNA